MAMFIFCVPRMKRVKLRRNRAFTLIEVLVVIVIIGLVAALMLPALQSARETSRRLQCASNLRQLGIAIQNYTSYDGMLPRGFNGYSIQVCIMPFLELGNLYDSINLTLSSPFPDGLIANQTATSTSVNVFLCPSDAASLDYGSGSNYAGNWGVGFLKYGVENNGPFSSPGRIPAVGLQQITDGTSQTVAMAEFCRGIWNSRNSKRAVFSTSEAIVGAGKLEVFASACRNIDIDNGKLNGLIKGSNWISLDLGQTLYNHVITPNGNTCINGTLTREGA